MSGLVSRWPVLQERSVVESDVDATGRVSGDAVARWVADARAAYLDRCTRLRALVERSALVLVERPDALHTGLELGRPTSVIVTASAPEYRPSSFTIAVRVRSVGGDVDGVVSTTCTVRLEHPETRVVEPLPDEIRDELIAIERSAQHLA